MAGNTVPRLSLFKMSKRKWTFIIICVVTLVTITVWTSNDSQTLRSVWRNNDNQTLRSVWRNNDNQTLRQSPFPQTERVLSEIAEKCARVERVSVEKNVACWEVHNNASSFWRSVTNGSRTHKEDLARMNLAAQCGAFNHVELTDYNPRNPAFPWEHDYLSLPPPRNRTDLVSTKMCSVQLINSSVEEHFNVGDKVVFKITLRRGNGGKTRGGDSVHLWLVNTKLGASTAADVVDNKDGTFTAISKLPWVGEVNVKAAVDHSRELFRTAIFIQRMVKTTHGFTGTFVNSQASESTPCSPFPAIQAFQAHEVCNLTEENGGFPWYCGKPIKSDVLGCNDWVSVRKLNRPSRLPLTELEEEILTAAETLRPFLIENNITFSVVQPSTGALNVIRPPEMSCGSRNLSLTFNDSNQSGYFYNNTWRPYDCHLPEVDTDFLSKCLKNTQFIIVGDSNSRMQMNILTKMATCTHKIPMTQVIWHAPLQCDNASLGLSIKYFPPKHPFYGSWGEDIKNNVLFSAVHILDGIPSTGNYLVHLHDFLHLVPFHLSLAEDRFHALRAAIERLLARNAKVHVIYQSAHSAYDRTPSNKHKLNVFLMDMQRRILSGLGDRVMFALTWPMTIAAENDDGHPKIADQFTQLYMGYVCGRW